jgi:hypothetical protein
MEIMKACIEVSGVSFFFYFIFLDIVFIESVQSTSSEPRLRIFNDV